MGANTKALRVRLKSVNSTLHLTKAMGLVASSKIRRANDAMLKGREYERSFGDIIDLLTASPECARSPYMRTGGDRTCLIVIAGDRGLAGGYNANVFRAVRELQYESIIPIGKRACDRFGKGFASCEHFSSADAVELANKLCADFAAGEFDRLGILSTEYISMMTQQPKVNYILPLTKKEGRAESSVLFEPDEMTILNSAVPEYIAGVLTSAVRESFASEVAARRMAMDSAGKNAQQMIDDLTLEYNRARQGAITQEITEIVAGSGN